jgi:hypothetical protein
MKIKGIVFFIITTIKALKNIFYKNGLVTKIKEKVENCLSEV